MVFQVNLRSVARFGALGWARHMATDAGKGKPGKFVYHLKDVTKTVGANRVLFQDVNLSFLEGAKIGVIGNNGSGKSSLLKVIAGVDKDFSGETWAQKNFRIGYLAQEPELDEGLTVLENVMSGAAYIQGMLQRFDQVSEELGIHYEDEEKFNALLAEQSDLQNEIDNHDGWELERFSQMAMEALHCPPGDSSVVNLSGGEKRRVALCRLLMERPDMLLLDEPTNHLDAQSVGWLERYLQEYPGTVIAITHDRYFLDKVARWILEMDRGQALGFEGNYTDWLEQRSKRLELESKKETNRVKQLKSELEWIRKAPSARQSKNSARVKAYERLANENQGERLEKAAIPIPPCPRLGQTVLEVENLHYETDEGRTLIKDLSFNLDRGAVLGIIGPNGTGKSTLLRILNGELEQTSGSYHIGSTVIPAFVTQTRSSLNPGHTVYREISGGDDIIDLGEGREVHCRSYVAAFNFRGPAQEKIIEQLSGGERNRVHLAKALKSRSNLLYLDEPTNDLDVDTLRSLEEALPNFNGSAVVVSHDRWFLDRICTHILAFEEDGHVEFSYGNFSDYEAHCKRRGIQGQHEKKEYRQVKIP